MTNSWFNKWFSETSLVIANLIFVIGALLIELMEFGAPRPKTILIIAAVVGSSIFLILLRRSLSEHDS